MHLTVGRRLDAHLHGGWDLSPLERLPLQARRAPCPRTPPAHQRTGAAAGAVGADGEPAARALALNYFTKAGDRCVDARPGTSLRARRLRAGRCGRRGAQRQGASCPRTKSGLQEGSCGNAPPRTTPPRDPPPHVPARQAALSPPLDGSLACGPAGGAAPGAPPCWALPAQHLLLPRPPGAPSAPPGSELWFSLLAFADPATMLRDDAPALPPACAPAACAAAGAARLRALMAALDAGAPGGANATGAGLLPAALSDALWTSLVDPLWRAAAAAAPSPLVRRVLLATPAGVVRVRALAAPATAPPDALYTPRAESWFSKPLGCSPPPPAPAAVPAAQTRCARLGAPRLRAAAEASGGRPACARAQGGRRLGGGAAARERVRPARRRAAGAPRQPGGAQAWLWAQGSVRSLGSARSPLNRGRHGRRAQLLRRRRALPARAFPPPAAPRPGARRSRGGAAVHALLYGAGQLRGAAGPASSFACGEASGAGRTRCFLIDAAGAVLTHPDSTDAPGAPDAAGTAAAGAQQAWPRFFGAEEPALMQELVASGVMKPKQVDGDVGLAHASLGGVRAYAADDGALPLGPARLEGSVAGWLFAAKLPGVRAYLVVVSQYEDRGKTLDACGLLAPECPDAAPPALVARAPAQRCGAGAAMAMAPQHVAQLPGFSADRTMHAFQMGEVCPEAGPPEWVTPLLLGVLGVLLIALAAMAVSYLHYRRKRAAWIAKWVSAEADTAGARAAAGAADAAPVARELRRAEERIAQLFRRAQVAASSFEPLVEPLSPPPPPLLFSLPCPLLQQAFGA